MLLRVLLIYGVFAACQLRVSAYMTPPDGFFDPPSTPQATSTLSPQDQDEEFDGYILSREDKPKSNPIQEEVEQLYESEKDRLNQDSVFYEDLRSLEEYPPIRLNTGYLRREDWYKDYTRCCNRTQGYRCRAYPNIRLSCFYDQGMWCCPLWNHYIVNCNCDKCAELSSPFVETGRCHRQYAKRTILAVCHNRYDDRWFFIRWVSRYWPSGCYCRTQGRDCCW